MYPQLQCMLAISTELSQRVKDTLTQQGKSGPAKHYVLDEFDPGHLAFHTRPAVLNAIALSLFQKKLKNNSVWRLFLKRPFNLPYSETCRQGFLQMAASSDALSYLPISI